MLARLLVQNAASLRAAAEVLAADFGFRAAIASDDRATILDALANQSGRIGAAVALYSDLRFEPVASTLAGADAVLAQARAAMTDDAAGTGDRAGVSLVGGRHYQLITVAVRAPLTIGYVTMGFPLTQRLVEDLGRLTPLKLALFVQRDGAGWQALDIGAHAAAAQPLGPVLGFGGPRVDLRLAGSAHVAQLVPLADGGGGTTGDDDLTVAPLSAREVLVFLNGNPWDGPSDVDPFSSAYPGIAGGGSGPDILIQGLVRTGLTVDGNGAVNGDQLFVYAPSEDALVDPATTISPFDLLGVGVIIPGWGVGNAYDDIYLADSLVTIDNGTVGPLVDVNIITATFVQIADDQLPGVIVNTGFEAAPAANGIADDIVAAVSFAIVIAFTIWFLRLPREASASSVRWRAPRNTRSPGTF